LAEDWREQGKSVEAFVTCDIVGGAHGSNGRYEPGRVRLFSEGVPSAGPKVTGSDKLTMTWSMRTGRPCCCHAFPSADEEQPLLEFVRLNAKAGDVYFVPVQVPKLTARRGSLSSDFKTARVVRQDARIIAPDFQQFRLTTGARMFVDFKSIPYKDIEVIEWHRRLQVAEAIQRPGGFEAVQLRVAEQYVHEFGRLAKTNNTVILPANLSDVGSMIALATSVLRAGKDHEPVRSTVGAPAAGTARPPAMAPRPPPRPAE
jgi:hypothetical protein